MAVHVIGCAYMQNVQAATAIFNDLCHGDFQIVEVTPERGNKKPYCRWRVKYIAKAPNGNYAPGENAKNVFEKLELYQPNNASVINKARSELPPAWIINYGVRCKCTKDFSFEMTQLCSEEKIKIECGSATGDEAIENEFLKCTEKLGMVQLEGHRSVHCAMQFQIENAEVLAKY